MIDHFADADADVLGAFVRAAADVREFHGTNIRAELGAHVWGVFLSQAREGTLRRSPESLPLVEGVDYVIDLSRGVVTILAHAFSGFPVEVSCPMQLTVQAHFHEEAGGRRREAQWKAERRGRRG